MVLWLFTLAILQTQQMYDMLVIELFSQPYTNNNPDTCGVACASLLVGVRGSLGGNVRLLPFYWRLNL